MIHSAKYQRILQTTEFDTKIFFWAKSKSQQNLRWISFLKVNGKIQQYQSINLLWILIWCCVCFFLSICSQSFKYLYFLLYVDFILKMIDPMRNPLCCTRSLIVLNVIMLVINSIFHLASSHVINIRRIKPTFTKHKNSPCFLFPMFVVHEWNIRRKTRKDERCQVVDEKKMKKNLAKNTKSKNRKLNILMID